MQIFNTLFPVFDFLYILQLEEYDHVRYLNQVRKRFFIRDFQKRGKLHFTVRIKLILILFSASLLLITTFVTSFLFFLGYVLFVLLFLPLLLLVPSLLISPIIYVFRKHTLSKTRRLFANTYPNTKIIAITGSYGKTTTKYALETLLKYSFKTAIVPDNINTPLGIANYLSLEKIPKDTEYLITEMGAYERGDIREAAQMLPPDIAILTCLGDQHLERFGSQDNLISAKNEIFTYAKPHAVRFADTSTKKILSDAGHKTDYLIEVRHDSTTANLALATAAASHLGVSDTLISDAVSSFAPPSRRNVIFDLNGVTVIDNSYNISPQTAEYLIKNAAAVAQQQNKVLVVLTAGIAEQGKNSLTVNRKLGEILNEHAAKVIVLPSVYAPHISAVLTTKIMETEFALSVIEDITSFIDPSSEVLLQLPEHTDLVYL